MKKYFLIGAIAFAGACAQPFESVLTTGEQDAPGVVNGKVVNLKTDKHAKTLVSLQGRRGGQAANCTGTVIAPRVILTAGHCLEGVKELNVRFATAPKAQAAVAEWKIHPKYRQPKEARPGEAAPDLALIRLRRPVPAGVKVAGLATAENAFTLGQNVMSYGYGFSAAGTNDFLGIFEWDYKDNNRQLNAGVFAVVAAKDAGTRLQKTRMGLDGAVFITYASKSSICQGDSGGPTFLMKTENPLIVGVNSFITDGRCINAMNGIVDLRYQRAWVDEMLAQWTNP